MLSTISATRWGSLPPDLEHALAPFNYRASNQIRPKFAQNPQFRRIRQLIGRRHHTALRLYPREWLANPDASPRRGRWLRRMAELGYFG